jgi:hypothetical protein
LSTVDFRHKDEKSISYKGRMLLDPPVDRVQRRVVVEPVTCPQIGGSKVGHDVLVGYLGQFLL